MRTVLLLVATFALGLLGCGTSSGYRVVAAPDGAIYGQALIGPLMLDIETISGTRCFLVKAVEATDASAHGVVWPYGTTTDGDSLLVPGLTEPLRTGDTFWAGGSGGGDGNECEASLGVCDRGSTYYLGPTASKADPRLTPAPGSS